MSNTMLDAKYVVAGVFGGLLAGEPVAGITPQH
jgi:hypothetical protein